jgi:hypothetical protein
LAFDAVGEGSAPLARESRQLCAPAPLQQRIIMQRSVDEWRVFSVFVGSQRGVPAPLTIGGGTVRALVTDPAPANSPSADSAGIECPDFGTRRG